MLRRNGLWRLLFSLGVVLPSGVTFAGPPPPILQWSAPDALNSTADLGAVGIDERVRMATDGAGTWVAVWQSTETLSGVVNPPIGADADILAATSTDNGATWSTVTPVNSSAVLDNNETDSFADRFPDIATDGAGTWICVWTANFDITGTSGSDEDIFYAVSTDNGQTWSVAALLNTGVVSASKQEPRIAYSASGTWLAAWHQSDNGLQIYAARSTDDGLNWIDETAVTNDDGQVNWKPQLATDDGGNWMIAFVRNTAADGPGIGAARSNDDGATWPDVSYVDLNEGAVQDDPALATDKRGNWMVVWASAKTLGGTVDNDLDLLFSVSSDLGGTWTTPLVLNTDAITDGANIDDARASVTTDGRGNWLAAWRRQDKTGSGFEQIFSAASFDFGMNWTAPVYTSAIQGQFTQTDEYPFVLTDGAGQWIAGWDTTAQVTPQTGSDRDILHNDATFTGALRGSIRDGEGAPVDCAAIVVRGQESTYERVAVADVNGEYAFSLLPAGAATVRVFSDMFEPFTEANVVISPGGTVTRDIQLVPLTLSGGVSGIVRGLAVDGNADLKIPLIGVRVEARVDGMFLGETYTCGSGRYAVNGLVPAKGDVTSEVVLTFAVAGYESDDRSVILAPGENGESNPTLNKAVGFPGSLAGVVLDADALTAIAGARVTAQGTTNVSAESDINGVYEFAALPEGRYDVRASAAGYTGLTQFQAVQNANITSLDFELAPEGSETSPTDLNGDNVTDAVDVQLVINGALGLPTGVDTDVNNDNETNAVDVQLVINGALGLS